MTRHWFSQKVNDRLDSVEEFMVSRAVLGVLWIGLGVTTWYNSVIADGLSVYGPMLVGVLCFMPKKRVDGLYHVFAFATAADRVLAYTAEGVWNPLFVWLILGSYMTNTARRSA